MIRWGKGGNGANTIDTNMVFHDTFIIYTAQFSTTVYSDQYLQVSSSPNVPTQDLVSSAVKKRDSAFFFDKHRFYGSRDTLNPVKN